MAKAKAKEKEVDLFGAPIGQIRERWGRPSFANNPENRAFVELMVATGHSQAKIAEAMGCDEKTLRKHFSRELAAGGLTYRVKMLQILHANAMKGNNAAASRLIKIMDEQAKPVRAPGAKADKYVSKKRTLEEAAANPGGEWGELLPKSVMQ